MKNDQSRMSISNRLDELGRQILRDIEGDQVKLEIAVTSLEDVLRIIMRPQPGSDGQNAPQTVPNSVFVDPQVQRQRLDIFGYGDELVPAVIGAQYDRDMMMQAQSIPFLYHKQ
jgi:hypothetical protein